MATVPACLTCLVVTTASNERVPICSHENVQSALSKYFWFNDEESTRGVLCQSCWHKIDDFHKFYCEIELLHSHRRQQHPIQLLEVKQEENHEPVFVATHQEDDPQEEEEKEDVDMEVKSEVDDKEEDGGGGGGSGGDDDDDVDYIGEPEKDEASDDDSPADDLDDPDFKGSKAKKSNRKTYGEMSEEEKAKIDEFIATNINMQCDTCSEKHSSFKDVQRHSRKAHKKRAFLFCCGRKFCNWTRLIDHVKLHLDPNLFACTKCSKKCPSNEALTSHMTIKHAADEEKTFQCDICPKKFSRLRLLTMHKKRHPLEVEEEEEGAKSTGDDPDYKEEDCSDEEEIKDKKPRASRAAKHWQKLTNENELITQHINLECDTCQQKANTYQELNAHSQSQHKKKVDLSCCGRKFIRKSRLIEHIHFHLNPSQFQCTICFEQFHNSQSLLTHMNRKHSTEETKEFKCSECPKSFAQKFLLANHERHHRRIKHKPFQCSECPKTFAFESVLQHHIRSAHTKEFNFVCHICAKGFHAVTYYNIHMETKHGEATNTKRDRAPDELTACAECGLTCTKRDLKKHMLRHTEAQRCDQCGQECKNVMALRWHKRQHNKPDIVCSVCEKVFKKAVNLREHMTTHTGEVLYSCDFCDRTFNSNANRASHRKKMHPKEWFEDKLRKNPKMMQRQLEQQMLQQL